MRERPEKRNLDIGIPAKAAEAALAWISSFLAGANCQHAPISRSWTCISTTKVESQAALVVFFRPPMTKLVQGD